MIGYMSMSFALSFYINYKQASPYLFCQTVVCQNLTNPHRNSRICSHTQLCQWRFQNLQSVSIVLLVAMLQLYMVSSVRTFQVSRKIHNISTYMHHTCIVKHTVGRRTSQDYKTRRTSQAYKTLVVAQPFETNESIIYFHRRLNLLGMSRYTSNTSGIISYNSQEEVI